MLACARNITQIYEELKRGNFAIRNALPGMELRGKTFGIAGIGAIGFETAKIVHDGFSMEVLAFDRYADRSVYPKWIHFVDTLDELLKNADVLSLHTPLTSETEHMICLLYTSSEQHADEEYQKIFDKVVSGSRHKLVLQAG